MGGSTNIDLLLVITALAQAKGLQNGSKLILGYGDEIISKSV